MTDAGESAIDHRTAIADYIRWCNTRARPKRHFAINSPIREPDYMVNVA